MWVIALALLAGYGIRWDNIAYRAQTRYERRRVAAMRSAFRRGACHVRTTGR